jgi:hypothetical protein
VSTHFVKYAPVVRTTFVDHLLLYMPFTHLVLSYLLG